MATFQADMDADRAATFFDTSGYGFGISVTHVAALTGTSTAVDAVSEEQVYSPFDARQITKLYWPDSGPTPKRGDRVTHESLVWHITNVRTLEGVYEVTLDRQDERQ